MIKWKNYIILILVTSILILFAIGTIFKVEKTLNNLPEEKLQKEKQISFNSEKIIVEECIGTVLNTSKDGKIIISNNSSNSYISYARFENIRVGSIILTQFVYGSDSKNGSGSIERFDYVLEF